MKIDIPQTKEFQDALIKTRRKMCEAAGILFPDDKDYWLTYHSILGLSAICGGDVDTIVDKLTGYLWEEDEAKKIKAAKHIRFPKRTK